MRRWTGGQVVRWSGGKVREGGHAAKVERLQGGKVVRKRVWQCSKIGRW